jgi:spore germination protein KA
VIPISRDGDKMPGVFNAIKNILTYKEPTNIEGFELLEGESEGVDRQKQEQKPVNINANAQRQEDPKDIKMPLEIDESNKKKNQNEGNKAQPDINKVSQYLNINLEILRSEFNLPTNKDVIIREFTVNRNMNAFIIFMDGMADRMIINDFILRQLMTPSHFIEFEEGCPLQYIMKNVLSVNDAKPYSDFKKDIIPKILGGLTGLFIDGCNEALLIESRGYEKRSVERPATETVIRGSQEAFTENLRTNITLVRKIIRNKDLITEMLPIGDTNNSTCAVMYLNGITNPELIMEVKRRIESIKTDYINGDGMLEQFIEDQPFMLFPQVINTERPDRAAAFVMDGQVIIIPDGTPFAITVPVTLWRLLYTTEDTNSRWQYGLALRLVRILAFLLSTFLPGLYVALVLYHQSMLPVDLLYSIAIARENVPFPTVVEILLMEISFELIREAGVRVPGVIGTTLGIIGALILGQAAVAASIVSPILIIIVAVTGLGSFAIPSYSLASGVRITRFAFIFLGATFGFYGISAGIFLLGCLACSMKSFGVPYLAPSAPKVKSTSLLPFVRKPIWTEDMRGDPFNPIDRRKQPEISRGWIPKKEGGK